MNYIARMEPSWGDLFTDPMMQMIMRRDGTTKESLMPIARRLKGRERSGAMA